ncbi:MliC family protein [uncultured Devosia sp.]|uniref:MliC family protein n=1 Tax=uncultured Devosia sp. TaxID=211434 RepID=UPI0035CC3601
MTVRIDRLALSVLLLAIPAAPSLAQSVQSTVTLSLDGDAEQKTVQYDCGEFGPLGVVYINAGSNFLALVPVEGETLIFTTVLSASGARYLSGTHEWATKGPEATLLDATAAQDAPPLASCSEIINTP